MSVDIDFLVKTLELQPHPEGGYFKETYRSTISENLGNPYKGERNHSTCIYFLLTSDSFSAFHKIHQDEIWHFYQGSPIDLHVISPSGLYECIKIGHDFDQGEVPQYVVPGGHWFSAEVAEPDSYSLVGCTVAPGFDFQDFELANADQLAALCPEQTQLIKARCKN